MNILLDRRRLLLGLAAASTAAAAPVAVSAAVPSTPENPDLLRLGDMLPALEAELVAAHEAYRAALAYADAHWPLAPDAIIFNGRNGWRGDYESRVNGSSLYRGENKAAKSLIAGAYFDREIDCISRAIKRATRRDPLAPFSVPGWGPEKRPMADWCETLDDLKAGQATLREYEAERARVTAASGFDQAKERRDAAIAEMEQHICSLMPLRETTMEGVIIKAHALAAWHRIDKLRALLPEITHGWSASLAASLIRIAEQQPA